MVAMIKESVLQKCESVLVVISGMFMGGFLIPYLIVNLNSQLQCVDIDVCHIQYDVNNIHNDSVCADFINSFLSIICCLVEISNNIFDNVDPFYSYSGGCIGYFIENGINYVIVLPIVMAITLVMDAIHFWAALTFLSDDWVKNLIGVSFIFTTILIVIIDNLERKPKENEKKNK